MKKNKIKKSILCVGDIIFHSGQAATFSGHKHQATPEVGAIYLFPSWLSHMVYPFKGEGERRTVASNLNCWEVEEAA